MYLGRTAITDKITHENLLGFLDTKEDGEEIDVSDGDGCLIFQYLKKIETPDLECLGVNYVYTKSHSGGSSSAHNIPEGIAGLIHNLSKERDTYTVEELRHALQANMQEVQ